MTARIVCVGNRLLAADACGPRVHDHLRQRPLPTAVELVDGGLAGLDLLPAFAGAERVVLVDATTDPAATTPRARPLAALAVTGQLRYDHDGALTYLLAALPVVLGAGCPAVTVVGVTGDALATTIAAVADLAVAVAADPSHPGWSAPWP